MQNEQHTTSSFQKWQNQIQIQKMVLPRYLISEIDTAVQIAFGHSVSSEILFK